MARSRTAAARLLALVLVAALLGLAQTPFSLALFGVLWWTTDLSWDNPASQLAEDLAAQEAPAGEPGRLAQEHVGVAAHAIARIEWSESATTIRNLSVPGRITRGPPAA